ncbi:MAG: N-acetylmuramoyl-L-alanine amidase [Rubrivivax sp.]|nr:N-acetylmuramoyl-L-alanine amidase [Rubrivivax sp.]
MLKLVSSLWRVACRTTGSLLILALAGCASVSPPGLQIDTTHTSVSQDSRAQFLVIHYTQANFELSMKILARGGLSVHYLLSDETPPRIYRLVDENRRAFHAGFSSWQGQGPLNAMSIGIEIVHPGVLPGPEGERFVPYRQDQIDALIPLVKDIVQRHRIRPDRVVGHNDIAPQRKVDPGPLFPWKRLADEGLILWPQEALVAQHRARFEQSLPDVAWFQQSLAAQGYEVPRHGTLDEPTRRVVATFQMKYRPERYDGQPDAQTAALLQALAPAPRPGAAPPAAPPAPAPGAPPALGTAPLTPPPPLPR